MKSEVYKDDFQKKKYIYSVTAAVYFLHNFENVNIRMNSSLKCLPVAK